MDRNRPQPAHSAEPLGADNDPNVAAAPLGTDDEAGGAPRRPANDFSDLPTGDERPERRGGVPVTVILMCVLIVGVAFALFTILGGAA